MRDQMAERDARLGAAQEEEGRLRMQLGASASPLQLGCAAFVAVPLKCAEGLASLGARSGHFNLF